MDNITIDGVLLTPLKQITHPKGDVFHAMKCVDPGFEGFGEVYFSSVLQGLVKAWKRHSRMTLNLVCIVGKIHFVLYDGRENSSTFGKYMEVILSIISNYFAQSRFCFFAASIYALICFSVKANISLACST